MQLYLFFRKDERGQNVFYPIELQDDEAAKKNAELNAGTIKVEDVDGNVVWRQQ